MRYQKVSMKTAKKLFYENKPFYICPCKFMPFTGWDCIIDPMKYWEDIRITTQYMNAPLAMDEFNEWLKQPYTDAEKVDAWNMMYNNWKFHNTNWEMGYYAHYYVVTDNQD